MDGERGVQSEVTEVRGLAVDEETSYVTITDFPDDPSSSDVPSLERRFREPVRLTALVLTMVLPQSTASPSQPATSASTPESAALPTSVQLSLTLYTKKPGDPTFTPLIDDSTGQPKVIKWADKPSNLFLDPDPLPCSRPSNGRAAGVICVCPCSASSQFDPTLLTSFAADKRHSCGKSTNNDDAAARPRHPRRHYRITHPDPLYQSSPGKDVPTTSTGLHQR